ncbi:hypothetical protein ACP70R_017077 [Stipagrostis hirtigluma subsp. patula]
MDAQELARASAGSSSIGCAGKRAKQRRQEGPNPCHLVRASNFSCKMWLDALVHRFSNRVRPEHHVGLSCAACVARILYSQPSATQTSTARSPWTRPTSAAPPPISTPTSTRRGSTTPPRQGRSSRTIRRRPRRARPSRSWRRSGLAYSAARWNLRLAMSDETSEHVARLLDERDEEVRLSVLAGVKRRIMGDREAQDVFVALVYACWEQFDELQGIVVQAVVASNDNGFHRRVAKQDHRMDRVIRFFSGGTIDENGGFEGMVQEVEVFSRAPSFDDICRRVRAKVGGTVAFKLRGRFDAGKARANYVILDIASADDWNLYRDIVASSQVPCAEVVVEMGTMPMPLSRVPASGGGGGVGDAEVEELGTLTQEKEMHDAGVGCVEGVEVLVDAAVDDRVHGSEAPEADFDMAVMDNDFDDGYFEHEEEELEEDARSISSGSEGYDDSGGEEGGEEFVGGGGDVAEENAPETDIGRSEEGPEFTEEELRSMRAVHVELPKVPLFRDLSRVGDAVCDSGLLKEHVEPDAESETIRKGMRFDSLPQLKLWMQDYSVRHHRPYNVAHSDCKKRYTIRCQRGCGWGVWARPVPRDSLGRWKVTKVLQPHTCATSRPSNEHSQCTARYIASRISGIISKAPETTVSSLIESIFGMVGYRVRYSKAWRAKKHAMELLWGDWKEAYNRIPRILSAMVHYNPGENIISFDRGKER